MNVKVLWEFEKQRKSNLQSDHKLNKTKDAKQPIDPNGTKNSIFANSGSEISEKIFEFNGFTLDFEKQATKRMYHNGSNVVAADLRGEQDGVGIKKSGISLHNSGDSFTRKSKKSMAMSGVDKKHSTQKLGKRSLRASVSSNILPSSPKKCNDLQQQTLVSQKKSLFSKQKQEIQMANESPAKTNNMPLQGYAGDTFGTRGDYVDGILYRSRMKKSTNGGIFNKQIVSKISNQKDIFEDLNASSNAIKEAIHESMMQNEKRRNSISCVKNDKDKFEGKQRCALTLCNWSVNPQNSKSLIREGALQALIELSTCDDKTTKVHCMTALMNLSKSADICAEIVQSGCVKTIVQTSTSSDDKDIQNICAMTLCNLSFLNLTEAQIVSDGAISALVLLMGENSQNLKICEKALFNLTCVKDSFYQIESIIKAFVSMSSSSEVSTKELCASAFCNLSSIPRLRLRLVEEGIVAAIATLTQSCGVQIKCRLASVICNLSALRACRSDLVSKGVIATLNYLANENNIIICYFVLKAICNLSKDPSSRARIISDGTMGTISLVSKSVLSNNYRNERNSFSNNDTFKKMNIQDHDCLELCALSIMLLSASEDVRLKIVEKDGVQILSFISSSAKAYLESNKNKGENSKIDEYCTLALCNLLTVKQSAMEIVNCGAVTSLIELSKSTSESTRDLCSTALFNLAVNKISRGAVASKNVIPTILDLIFTCKGRLQTLLRCSASLCYFASDPSSQNYCVDENTVSGVIELLSYSIPTRKHASTNTSADDRRTLFMIIRFASATICVLSPDKSFLQSLINKGGITSLIRVSKSGDFETQSICCAALASMTSHSWSRMLLVEAGILPALTELSRIRDSSGIIQRRCANAFANLSCEEELQPVLIESSGVKVIAALSNSYSENNQNDCAHALCNLAICAGFEKKMVNEGAVAALLMIGMVRAVNLATKATCVQALLNLLNQSTLNQMLLEGIIKVIPSFISLKHDIAYSIAIVIFAKLAQDSNGRSALCKEKPVFADVLMSSCTQSARVSLPQNIERILYHTLCKLIESSDSMAIAVNVGIISSLCSFSTTLIDNEKMHDKQNSNASDGKFRAMVTQSFFVLSMNENVRLNLVSSEAISHLIELLKSAQCPRDDKMIRLIILTFSNLAWYENTRLKMIDTSQGNVGLQNCVDGYNICNCLINLITAKLSLDQIEILEMSIRSLCFMSSEDIYCSKMLEYNVLSALKPLVQLILPSETQLHKFDQHHNSILETVSLLMRGLCKCKVLKEYIHDDFHPVQLFCVLAKYLVNEMSILDCSDFMCSLAMIDVCREQFLTKEAIAAVGLILAKSMTTETAWRCAASICNLASDSSSRSQLVHLGGTKILSDISLFVDSNIETLKFCSQSMCYLSNENETRAKMVEDGAISALVYLLSNESLQSKELCEIAISHLSSATHEVETGTIETLIKMSNFKDQSKKFNRRVHPGNKSMSTKSVMKPQNISNKTIQFPGLLKHRSISSPEEYYQFSGYMEGVEIPCEIFEKVFPENKPSNLPSFSIPEFEETKKSKGVLNDKKNTSGGKGSNNNGNEAMITGVGSDELCESQVLYFQKLELSNNSWLVSSIEEISQQESHNLEVKNDAERKKSKDKIESGDLFLATHNCKVKSPKPKSKFKRGSTVVARSRYLMRDESNLKLTKVTSNGNLTKNTKIDFFEKQPIDHKKYVKKVKSDPSENSQFENLSSCNSSKTEEIGDNLSGIYATNRGTLRKQAKEMGLWN